jgi:hypothetical protein
MKIDDAMLCQVMERVWLIMAFISSTLSDHPVIKSKRSYRRLTDRSRKALFDLHNDIEATLLRNSSVRDVAPAKQRRSKAAKDDFGSEFLRLKGTISPDVQLGIDDDPSTRGRRRPGRRRRS